MNEVRLPKFPMGLIMGGQFDYVLPEIALTRYGVSQSAGRRLFV